MPERPMHPQFRARMKFGLLGLDIRGSGERSPEAQAAWEAECEKRHAEFEREFGEAAMPKLLEQYERDLAAYEATLAAAKNAEKKTARNSPGWKLEFPSDRPQLRSLELAEPVQHGAQLEPGGVHHPDRRQAFPSEPVDRRQRDPESMGELLAVEERGHPPRCLL